VATGLTQFRCLELVPIRWATDDGEYSEAAVLHEIGPVAGLFQVDREARSGTTVLLTLPHGEISGTVQACTPEDNGFILTVRIECAQSWLGGSYRPSVLIPLNVERSIEWPLAS